MCQEPVQVLLCELARMCAVVKQEEAANPVEVSLLGGCNAGCQSFKHAVVEPRCRLTRNNPSGMRLSAAELLMTLRLPLRRYAASISHARSPPAVSLTSP